MAEDRAGLILFDDGKGTFGPLCDLRPVFALRTGAHTTAERLERRFGRAVALRVPESIAALTAESSGLPTNELPAGDRFLMVNGRLTSARGMPEPAVGEAVLALDGTVLLALLDRPDAERWMSSGSLPDSIESHTVAVALLEAPWTLLDQLAARIVEDIESCSISPEAAQALGLVLLPEAHGAVMGKHAVLVHATATIAPQVVFDASAGPILVAAQATIRPFSVLAGPCAIGIGSTITDRSLIKANTSCGPHCRLGGEIGGTSIAGYTNKAHDGHLGDSVVGEWVNLGAGTDNSNLLNTYSEVPVRLEPEGPRVRSGRLFFGSVIGDHTKCAIGTRLMTGTVLGTGAMIARSTPPPATVRRFAWLTDDGERRYTLSKFCEVATTVMARRSIVPGQACLARLAALHAALPDFSPESH